MAGRRGTTRLEAPIDAVTTMAQPPADAGPLMRSIVQALQELNRNLIAENDALKAENLQHQQLSKTQDEYIDILEKKVRAHEEALDKFGKKVAENFKTAAETMVTETIPKVLKNQASSTAKRARQARTESGSALVKAKALALYDARGGGSIAAAARSIFAEVQAYACGLERRQSLSRDRFAKTLGEWVHDRNGR